MNAPAREASLQKNLQAEFCVVGAGYAGLTAALRLHKAHKSVVVLEARGRIGGRVWSDPLSDGTPVDIGGHWVGPQQPFIQKLAREMGISTYKSYQEGDILLVDNQGEAKRFPAAFLDTNPFGLVELGAAFAALDQMASEVPTTAPWEAVKARDWDSQTLATWINTNVDDPFARDVLRATLGVFLPSDTAEISLLHMLFIIHAVGGLEGLMIGGQYSGLGKGGAQAVADKINAILGPAVHLNAPVRQIAQDDSGVEVTSDAVSVRAGRVIVTIPPTLTGHIRYLPPLPPARAQVIQRMPMGSVIKATLVYDEAFWRCEGLSGTSIATNSPVVGTADGGLDKDHDRPGLLIAFVGGNQARALGRLSPAARQEIIVKEVAARFGPKAAKLSQHIVYPPTGLPYVDRDWAAEEWTRGDYSAYLPPGVLTGFKVTIWEQFDRIHWAGTETATEHPGYIDGAVQSGEQAATDVLAQG
ncbi:MAG TPA: NAD(P)/FAD-dependent oxidoreductase [Thermoanaerobaculia bacterium]|jgi:monoamine oxidase|nr:NAD(P)/FAD-dependent oxidoreductase [Thermoanaerobaculia bacterium]